MSDAQHIDIPLTDLAEGTMLVRSIGDREIVICRTKAGLHALDNICTHAYARLNEGRLRGTRLICPLHGASFDVRDGRALGAPASRPLATYAVHVVGDSMQVTVAAAETKPMLP
jgi:3-phenylpropionate/trans-cinnamate dioxygenase ferredoxin subunit